MAPVARVSSPLDRAQEIVDDECISTDEYVQILQALVNVAKAAEGVEIWLRQRQSCFDNETGSPYAQLREALAELNKEPA